MHIYLILYRFYCDMLFGFCPDMELLLTFYNKKTYLGKMVKNEKHERNLYSCNVWEKTKWPHFFNFLPWLFCKKLICKNSFFKCFLWCQVFFRAPLLQSGGLHYVAVGGLYVYVVISYTCSILIGCDESCDMA